MASSLQSLLQEHVNRRRTQAYTRRLDDDGVLESEADSAHTGRSCIWLLDYQLVSPVWPPVIQLVLSVMRYVRSLLWGMLGANDRPRVSGHTCNSLVST